MREILNNSVHLIIQIILFYFITLHLIYFVLIILGFRKQRKYQDAIAFGEFKRIAESPLTLPISIVISAYNEEKMIVDTLLNILQLNYPKFEIIVVNDGSADATLALLQEHFQLRVIHPVIKKNFEVKPIRAVYRSALHPHLMVIDKENGRRADANNTGVDYAKYPLICQIDADCLLEKDALLRMVRPFLDSSKVVAATGMIRPSNGLIVDQGEIIRRDLPTGWLPMLQYVEYLRSFQWARAGLSEIGCMMCMSGAYTLIKKDMFIKVGGANINAVVDDFELTVSVLRYIYEHRESELMEIAFVPDPGCYSEVPETWKALASQRNFWQRAILQSLIWNRVMAFNPKYGVIGMVGYPYYFFFEALSALVELSAYLLIPLAYFWGIGSLQDVVLLFIFGSLLGSFVSLSAVVLQETTRFRQAETKALCRLLISGFLENFGYHQFHVIARVIGIYDLLIRGKLAYGYRTRSGYRKVT
jgi:cellulose synthase/poly-beta-1,6-N-acetylglucosamine synthase-like glycosyltransferase